MSLIDQIFFALTHLHPPHIMFVHFPIGLTGGAAFFMLLALWRKDEILEKIAFADIALAAPAVIVAMSFGIRDNIHFYNGLAPNHIAKIVLASTLFVLTAGTAYARWKNPNLFHTRVKDVFYKAAFFVSFAISIVLGFLGGVIVYGI